MPSAQDPTLLARGERVVLLSLTEADRQEHISLRRASIEFHRTWDPRPPPGEDPHSEATQDRLLASACQPTTERTLLRHASSNTLLGAINFNSIVRGAPSPRYTPSLPRTPAQQPGLR